MTSQWKPSTTVTSQYSHDIAVDTHTFFGIDHDLHFQSLASCGHEHIGLHVQKVDDKGRFRQSGSEVSKRTDALRSRPTFPRCPACHTRVRTCMTVYLTTYTKAFTYDSIVTRPVEMVRGVNTKYLWLSGSSLFVWAQAVLLLRCSLLKLHVTLVGVAFYSERCAIVYLMLKISVCLKR